MKYFVLVLVILVCGLIYVRLNQPSMWNEWLVDLKAPDGSSTNDASATAPADAAATNTPPPPPVRSSTPEIISPDSTHLNPDHVKPVDQPGDQTTPTTTNAPGTNAPSTNAGASTQPIDTTGSSPTKMTGLPTSIPPTITTLSGKTYTGCVLSSVTPDAISFIDSAGGADVKFTDLDPSFGTVFGYDPVAGQKYEQDQAALAQKIAAAQIAAQAPSPANLSPAPISTPAPAPPGLSPGQREAIQNRITALQSDIDFMQSEHQKKLSTDQRTVLADGGQVSHGGYDDRIASDQTQMAQLQQQLQK